jgi:hypothetical protein
LQPFALDQEMTMDVPKEFFTLQTMLTLSGATGAVFVIANGSQLAFNFNPRWLALAIAQVIVLSGVYLTQGHGPDYFVGVVNGFLVYCTAAGATLVSNSSTSRRAVHRSHDVSTTGEAGYPQVDVYRRRFLTSWF